METEEEDDEEEEEEATFVVEGKLGILKMDLRSSLADAPDMRKARRRLTRIEKQIRTFFGRLACRLEDMEGIDLTDEGEDLIGQALCAFAPSEVAGSCMSCSDDEDAEDEDFSLGSTGDEEEEEEDCEEEGKEEDEDGNEEDEEEEEDNEDDA
jgi:hypothetical protein